MSMRPDIKRPPIFGLGCVGGAAGLARAADYLRAFPTHTAMLVSVELCSLTMQLQDKSIANVIASGLFADGAAAALLVGGARSDSSLPHSAGCRIALDVLSRYRGDDGLAFG
jgi:alkylresorcinol/alkylpyrone synthase